MTSELRLDFADRAFFNKEMTKRIGFVVGRIVVHVGVCLDIYDKNGILGFVVPWHEINGYSVAQEDN